MVEVGDAHHGPTREDGVADLVLAVRPRVLVDDVLYSGRTVKSALTALDDIDPDVRAFYEAQFTRDNAVVALGGEGPPLQAIAPTEIFFTSPSIL